MQDLDVAAWDRWKAYRTAIRKPIKPASEHAMQMKLAKYGADQDAVVNQSISNQWQGLFDLKVSKPAPGEKPVKTDKQIAADNERWQQMQDRCGREWDRHLADPLAKLKLLREQMAGLLREANAAKVYADPHLRSTVWQVFGDRGIARLKQRAAAEQTNPSVVANMAGALHQRGPL